MMANRLLKLLDHLSMPHPFFFLLLLCVSVGDTIGEFSGVYTSMLFLL